MSILWTLLTALPELIKLLQAIQQAQVQADVDRRVKDDLKTIHQAFTSGDASKITALFSNVPAPDPVPPV